MRAVFQRHDLDQLLQSLEELRGHCLAMEQSLKDEAAGMAVICPEEILLFRGALALTLEGTSSYGL